MTVNICTFILSEMGSLGRILNRGINIIRLSFKKNHSIFSSNRFWELGKNENRKKSWKTTVAVSLRDYGDREGSRRHGEKWLNSRF